MLVVPTVDYDGLADAMRHMIGQNAAGSAAVLICFVEVLIAVAGCERDPARPASLRRRGVLALGDGVGKIAAPADLAGLRQRHIQLLAMIAAGPISLAQPPGDAAA